jgi:hypothetical protein
MLTKMRRAAVLVAAAAVLSGPSVALADDKPPLPIVVDGDNHSGVVDTSVTDIGSPPQRRPPTDEISDRSGNRVVCRYTAMLLPTDLTIEVRAGIKGRYYWLDCTDGRHTVAWVPESSAANGQPQVSAGELAQQALNRLPLPAPDVHFNPNQSGGRPQTVVGVPTWFWVTSATYRTLTQTTSAGGVWARVVARPLRTEWRTGSPDAHNVVCDGAGTPYDTKQPASSQSSSCTTTYLRSSADQPRRGPDPNDRFFIGTVTTVWRVTWTGSGGASGSLADIRRQSNFPIAVAELQTENQ